MYEVMRFEKDKGNITVDDNYVYMFDNENPNKGRKYALSRVDEQNIKILHDVLKLANLGDMLLTKEALEKFDAIIEGWRGEE